MPCEGNCQRLGAARRLFRFDTPPCPCYYCTAMKILDAFGLTYSYLGGGYAPTQAR
jgi:hypothetical protein